MTLAKAKAKTNETFIVQASLTIVTYDRQNIFIVQAIAKCYSANEKNELPKLSSEDELNNKLKDFAATLSRKNTNIQSTLTNC
jgi:hypothetical protein